jgi:hypothetical protein
MPLDLALGCSDRRPGRKSRYRETIALLLARAAAKAGSRIVSSPAPNGWSKTEDGTISPETLASPEKFDATARTTTCFRRGTPIHNPGTRKIIGYEMEEVPMLSPATWR